MATRSRSEIETMVSIRRPFKVIFTREAVGGYSASVPDLPGCYSEGDTLAEAKRNIRDAIGGYLEATAILAARRATKRAKGAKGTKDPKESKAKHAS